MSLPPGPFRRRAAPPALAGGPLLIAHRGGAGLAPENTLAAFRSAEHDWAADMIELDVRASLDGECIVIHDATLDRTTSGSGAVTDLPLDQIQGFDAGYRFTPDGGASFPLRGRGVRVPTFDEVLAALPRMRFTVELKSGDAQPGLAAAIERHGAHERVIIAGMHDADRIRFHDYAGTLSASGRQLSRFYLAHRCYAAALAPLRAQVVQMCETWRGRRLLTPRLVRDLARRGVPVHVWTVNDEADMHRLLDWGVDGLLTDYPDRLARVLHERVGRPLPPALRA
ncbi:MAG TPA: glycerophosphodiester phosphodiesterase [Longimicrobiales bacterium]|nr:glycerophosphodiester phosphodiesterase [Longimicrobiales bacterium]